MLKDMHYPKSKAFPCRMRFSVAVKYNNNNGELLARSGRQDVLPTETMLTWSGQRNS